MPAQLEEGGIATLTEAHLDCTLLRERLQIGGLRNLRLNYRMLVPPAHGVLNINGENATVNTMFSQMDINRGGEIIFCNPFKIFNRCISYRELLDIHKIWVEIRRKQAYRNLHPYRYVDSPSPSEF